MYLFISGHFLLRARGTFSFVCARACARAHTHTNPSIATAQFLSAGLGSRDSNTSVQIPSSRKVLTGWPLSEIWPRFF